MNLRLMRPAKLLKLVKGHSSIKKYINKAKNDLKDWYEF